jgi:hypothetical protein
VSVSKKAHTCSHWTEALAFVGLHALVTWCGCDVQTAGMVVMCRNLLRSAVEGHSVHMATIQAAGVVGWTVNQPRYG